MRGRDAPRPVSMHFKGRGRLGRASCTSMKKTVFRIVEALIVGAALVVLTVRYTASDAYQEYRRTGGRNGFWSWFAKEKCGASLPGVEDQDAKAAAEEKKANLAQLEAREKELVAAETKEMKRLEAARKKLVEQKRKKSEKGSAKGKGRSFTGSSGKVKTGGKSSYRAGMSGQTYRVNGIQGIEFGSTDNAPAEGVKPLLSVSYDADGNAEFRQLKWRENRELSDAIYGFDQAWLDHTYDSGQLSEVILHKKFPMTEEGVRQAMEFYSSMSDAASRDLGFDIIDIDRTGNAKSATICEFRNGDGETAIRGTVSTWSDNSVTVTLKVQDKGYVQMQQEQSAAAYERGDPGLEDARIDVWGKDFTSSKGRANELLGK